MKKDPGTASTTGAIAGLVFIFSLVPPFVSSVRGSSVDDRLRRFCQTTAGSRTAVGLMDVATGDLIACANDTILYRMRFPPGSVFKLVTALAALGSGAVAPAESIFCSGSTTLHGRKWECSLKPGHGWIDLERALVCSCNNYFERLADRLDGIALARQARAFKFDERVGVDLPGEVPGIVTTPVTDSARIDFAIGQGGSLQLTPVALLSFAAGIANHGRLVRPKLDRTLPPRILALIPDNRGLALVREAMRRCVRSGIGTATAAALPGIDVAGKTGTPVFVDGWETHGWFIGFAPYERPEVAIVVLVLEGQGKTDAAPVAGKVLAKYFELKNEL